MVEIKDTEILQQISSVLRLKTGDKLILCDSAQNEAIQFDEALENGKQNDLNIIFDPSGSRLSEHVAKSGKIGIFIGVEGGLQMKK